ncbi:hypothetical protein RSAG8_14010, partial [Rhizoctonia solani AG-8 WAC10335]
MGPRPRYRGGLSLTTISSAREPLYCISPTLHASLVLGVNLGQTRTSEGHTQRYPSKAINLPDQVTDSSDINPIVILNVTSLP